MSVFLCEATFKPLDQGFRQRPTADATPDPIVGPSTTCLRGDVYIFSEDQVVEVVCQSHDTPTCKKSVTHHDVMVLKDVMWGVISESDEALMSEASPFNVWPEVWEVNNEVQEMPTVHNEPAGTGGCGSVYEGVCKGDGQVAIKCIPEKNSYLHINVPGEACKVHIEVALLKIVSKPPLCNNLLQLLDWFEMSNCLLLVLEKPVPCMDVFSLYESKDGVLDELLAKIIMLQVGDLQSSDMAAQTSEDAFPEHVDSQQILKALKKHFALC